MEKSTLVRIRKFATAIGFSVVICGVALGPACAGGHGDNKHHEEHHEVRHDVHHRGHDYGYVPPARDYYYAPAPNYYSAPEPYYYAPQPTYEAPPPPSGINLFFGR